MEFVFYGLAIFIVVALLFFSSKYSSKTSFMKANFLLNSKTTTDLIINLENEENEKSERRLNTNGRYRTLKSLLDEEILKYREMSVEQAKVILNKKKVSKLVFRDERKVKIIIYNYLSDSTPAIHIFSQPNMVMGGLIGLDEWIYYKIS